MDETQSEPEVILLDGDDYMHPVEDASNFNESRVGRLVHPRYAALQW